MATNSNHGWQPNGELPPSIQGMVAFAVSLQSSCAARKFLTNFALCAYKCGFDDATFAAQMNQMMNERENDANH